MIVALISDAQASFYLRGKQPSHPTCKKEHDPNTSSLIATGLRALGHQVERIEAGSSLSNFIGHLEASNADIALSLIKPQEHPAFVTLLPAVLDELQLSYVGASAGCCHLVSSSSLLALALREHGLCQEVVKSLDEGSNSNGCPTRIISVPFLAEILAPCEFLPEAGHLEARPAKLSKIEHTLICDCARRAIKAVGLRDWGQVDIVLSKSKEIAIRSIHTQLSFSANSVLFAAARALWKRKNLSKEGLLQAILGRLLKTALERTGARSKQPKLKHIYKVGVAYNLKRLDVEQLIRDDSQAEFDSPTTVQALMDAISALDYEVVPLEATADFAQKAASSGVDLVFNIAEGIRGRNRESQVPSALELLGIPYTGSDPSCLCLTLDKGLAKRIVNQAGVPTPKWILMSTGKERLPKDLSFPLIVKPLAEGSSKGVSAKGVVNTEIALRAVVSELTRRYHQPALVEEFVGGREFTVGVIGESKLRVLPVMEVVFTDTKVPNPIYGYEQKMHDAQGVRFDCPAILDHSLQKTIASHAKAAFRALGCRDVARIDFRMDAKGNVHFIECNPLPGLAPNFSDLAVIANAAGLSYEELIQEILSFAIRRSGLKRSSSWKRRQYV